MVIFISAVSQELRSTRKVVAETLHALGYDPKWQDIAATDSGDLCGVLRKWVDESDAVLQVVGQCYGFGPKNPPPQYDECSYTQYEALYAKDQGKPVYYIFTDATHPTDGCGCEPKSLHDLQAHYRKKVKSYGHLYHRSDSLDKTELIVRRLKDDLAEMRREARETQDYLLRMTEESLNVQRKQLAAIQEIGFNFSKVVQGGSLAKLQQEYDDLLRDVAGWYDQDPKALANEMRKRAQVIVADPDEKWRAKVIALREAGHFIEARNFAIEAAQRSSVMRERNQRDEVRMWIEVAMSEIDLGRFDQALAYARRALTHADQQSDFPTWAAARYQQGRAFRWLNRHKDACAIFDELMPLLEGAFGRGSLPALQCRRSLAISLYYEGRVGVAELHFRELVLQCELELGATNLNTLTSRVWLANTFISQGNLTDARRHHEFVLNAVKDMRDQKRHLTLTLGLAVFNEAISKLEHSVVSPSDQNDLIFLEKATGIALSKNELLCSGMSGDEEDTRGYLSDSKARKEPEKHTGDVSQQVDPVLARLSQANALRSAQRYPEAEMAYREALTLSECVSDTDPTNVAWGCYYLAFCLEEQQRFTEALAFMLNAEKVWAETLTIEHPYAKRAKRNRERIQAKLKG